MTLAIIGGMPARFRPFVDLHQESARLAGHSQLPVAVNSHGYVAETSQQAVDESFPHVAQMMNTIGRERGWSPLTREQYESEATLRGANFVGSPQQVIERTLSFRQYVGDYQRQLFLMDHAGLPLKTVLEQLDALGEILPALREGFAEGRPGHVPDAPQHPQHRQSRGVLA